MRERRTRRRVRRTKKMRARRQMRNTRDKKMSKKYKKRLIKACKLCKDENLAQIRCHKQMPKFSHNRTRKQRKNCFELWRVYHKCMRKHGMRRGSSRACK